MTSSYLGLILVVLCASSCLSHSDSHGGDVDVNSGVKGGGSGIKSYGGYSHDHNQGSAHQQSQFYQQPARQPQYNYQPYGWNYNQPTRTYGKKKINLVSCAVMSITFALNSVRRCDSTKFPKQSSRLRMVWSVWTQSIPELQ